MRRCSEGSRLRKVGTTGLDKLHGDLLSPSSSLESLETVMVERVATRAGKMNPELMSPVFGLGRLLTVCWQCHGINPTTR